MKSPQEPPGTGPGVSITGGPKSTEADFTDMLTSARLVDTGSHAANTLSGDLSRVVGGLPIAATVMSPGTAARVAAEALVATLGPNGLIALTLQLEVLAQGLRLSVRLYQAQDAAAAASMSTFHFVTAPAHVVGVLAGVAHVSAQQTLLDVALGPLLKPDHRLTNPLTAFTQHFSQNLGTAQELDPALTDDAIRDVRMAAWLAFPGSETSFESQIGSILAVASAFGILKDDVPLTVAAAGVNAVRPPPESSIGGLVGVEAQTESAGNAARSRLTVDHRVDVQGRGHWVVNVPGTQEWGMHKPANPSDAAANLRLMAGLDSSLLPAVTSALTMAMKKSGVKPGKEPVMLVGHSQGGIAAARMAANPQFRTHFNVTHIVTIAAPASRIPVPKSIQALSIEHSSDPVPHLDTRGGPGGLNHVRAKIDPRVMMAPDKGGLIGQHDGHLYALTSTAYLGRGNNDAALRDWYAKSEGFMGGSDTRYSYNLSRPQPAPALTPQPHPQPQPVVPTPKPEQPPAWMTPRPWTAQTPSG